MNENPLEALSDRELLEQINLRLIRIERRQKAISIRKWIVTGLIVLGLIILAIILAPKIRFLIEQYKIIAENIENIAEFVKSIDAEQVKEAFRRLGEINAEKVNELMGKLSEFDYQALLNQIKTLLEPLSKLSNLFNFK